MSLWIQPHPNPAKRQADEESSRNKGGFQTLPVSNPTEGSNKSSNEQQFTIQPYPAKTNDPKDLEPPQPGGGLSSVPEIGAFHARDPHIPSQEILNNLGPASSSEELKKRSKELNE